MNERATAQLRVIKAVVNALGAVGISAWLFGSWGLDARIGRITREHGDVEFWVERLDAGRSKAVLVEAGATALATQPPEESCEFTWGGTDFSTAYFDRWPDGSFSRPSDDADRATSIIFGAASTPRNSFACGSRAANWRRT